MSFQKCVIIGANGGFGVLLSNLLSNAGYTVSGIDLQPASVGTAKFSRYISSDIMNISPEAAALIQESECIILSLPEEIALECFPKLVETLPQGSLLLDILSVKSAIVAKMKDVERPVELLSLHPMFAPKIGFQGQNVVAIEVRSGPLSAKILSFIRNCGAHVTFMNADEHDVSTAAIQVATHAAIISFGLTLYSMDYDIEMAAGVSTPLHRAMLSLLARILATDPEIYWRIQLKHPLSARTRDSLKESLLKLDKVVLKHDFEEFKGLLDSIRARISSEQEKLNSSTYW
ncbi:MAG: prephenate dehydrogenase/arogenate dehydrogenase family protein [Acidobacteria bacterium]|nr:prephenate dehydrogenase/arogenate dehydrogenase family protein [Acidobacteriota bacterium]MCA1643553.1 prephenate dehydrogenase/arogenate dehydrogenase family protein [Acidobacteriota bacterium]